VMAQHRKIRVLFEEIAWRSPDSHHDERPAEKRQPRSEPARTPQEDADELFRVVPLDVVWLGG